MRKKRAETKQLPNVELSASESRYLHLLPEPLDHRVTTLMPQDDPVYQQAVVDLKTKLASRRQPHAIVEPQQEPSILKRQQMSLVSFTPLPSITPPRKRKLRLSRWLLGGGGIFSAAFLVTLGLFVFSSGNVDGVPSKPRIQVVVAPPPPVAVTETVAETAVETAVEADTEQSSKQKSVDGGEAIKFQPEVIRRHRRAKRHRASVAPTTTVDDILAAAGPRRAKRVRRKRSAAVVDEILAAAR